MNLQRMATALKLCILAVTAAALGAALPTPQASATAATLAIGSTSAHVGEEVSVDLQALGVAEPGLGAWTVDIQHDSSVVSAVRCSAPVGLCSTAYMADTARVTGATYTGLVGHTTLSTLTYECGTRPGVSSLELRVSVFAEAPPDPFEIDYVVVNGTITCLGGSGDVSCDGAVDSIDAMLVLQSTTTILDQLPCAWNADVNTDGTVNAVDAALILQFEAGLIDRLPR